MDDEGFSSDATDNDTSFNKAPYLVVDSNALFGNWLLAGERWAHVVDLAHRGLLHLRVPEVVFDEIIRHYKKDTSEIAGTLIGFNPRQLRDLLAIDVPDAAEIRRRADEVSDHNPTTLREKLRHANAEILQIPLIEHRNVLARDLEERQPFDKKGKGYRDTLIWHTILSLCQNLDADNMIAFVTNNTNDFCRNGVFSSEPLDEISQIDNPPQFIHYNTMRNMMAAMADRLAGLDDRLGTGELSEEQTRALRAALAETMPAACEALAGVEVSTNNDDDHYYMSGLDFAAFPAFPVPFEGVSVSSIEPDPESMEWTFIDRDDTDGSMHFTVSVEANIELDGVIFKSDWYSSEDDSVYILDYDWNDHYVWASINHTGTLHFDVMVSGDSTGLCEWIWTTPRPTTRNSPRPPRRAADEQEVARVHDRFQWFPTPRHTEPPAGSTPATPAPPPSGPASASGTGPADPTSPTGPRTITPPRRPTKRRRGITTGVVRTSITTSCRRSVS